MLDALPIMRDGRFLEAETRAALAAGPWPARAPDRNLADLKAQIAACQAGAAAVADDDPHLRRATPSPATWPSSRPTPPPRSAARWAGSPTAGPACPMDGGGEIVVRTTVDAAAGEATLDFTGSAPTSSPPTSTPPRPSSTPRRSTSSAPWWTTTSR